MRCCRTSSPSGLATSLLLLALALHHSGGHHAAAYPGLQSHELHREGINTNLERQTHFSAQYMNLEIDCSQPRRSTLPYFGNDAFFDFADFSFDPIAHGNAQMPQFPGMKIFLHPVDVQAFGSLVGSIQVPFAVLSNSNQDELIPYLFTTEAEVLREYYEVILDHPMLAGWFGANMVMHHPRLHPIPLGSKWQWFIAKHHAEDDHKASVLAALVRHASHPERNFYELHKPNLLQYLRLTMETSDWAAYEPWKGSRRTVVEALRRNFEHLPEPHHVRSPEPPACTGSGKVEEKHGAFEHHLVTLATFKFVASPPGQGPDCHRTWEALLMGAIPIVLSGPFDRLYDDLPVLKVKLEDWDKLTPEVLEHVYADMHSPQRTWRFDKLFAPYWFDQIEQAITERMAEARLQQQA